MNDIDAQALAERRAVWTRFWASGALHSCATSYQGNYGGALKEFWLAELGHTPREGCMLDIATGNGPIPKLLLDATDRPDIRCHAIDVAAVAPVWLAGLTPEVSSRVQFHAGVAAESLPFDAQTFDLVTSQYGIEYSDLQRSLAEAIRVLKATGRIALVLHHQHSLPVRLATEEVRHIDWLLESDGYLDTAREMTRPMALSATEAGRNALRQDARSQTVKGRFDQHRGELQRRATASQCPDVLHETVDNAARAFTVAVQHGERQGLDAMAQLRLSLTDSRLRLSEMRMSALDEGNVRQLATAFESGGMTTRTGTVSQQGELMGWTLTAARFRV